MKPSTIFFILTFLTWGLFLAALIYFFDDPWKIALCFFLPLVGTIFGANGSEAEMRGR